MAYAISSRAPTEPMKRRGSEDKMVPGYGVTTIAGPKDETTRFYESIVQPKHAKWHHLKPPAMPLYRQPGV